MSAAAATLLGTESGRTASSSGVVSVGSASPTRPPSTMAPSCPQVEGKVRARIAAATVGCQAARHAGNREGDHGDGSGLEAGEPARAKQALKTDETVGEENEDQGRGQGEPGPGCKRPRVAGARQADGEAV